MIKVQISRLFFILFTCFMPFAPVTADTNAAEKLLIAYDKYRSSWLSSEIMIWCNEDITKLKLSKNTFGKETLYKLVNSNWERVPNIKINGYAISWSERDQKIELRNIISNQTLCEGKSSYDCFKANYNKVTNEFINVWKLNYHPSLSVGEFDKYFTITSTSNVSNLLSFDTAYFASEYLDDIQKIKVTVSKYVSHPPASLRRQTIDEYKISTLQTGECRLVE